MKGQDCISDYICYECGRIVSVYEQRTTANIHDHSQHVCYECAFWLSKAGNLKPFEQVINNQLFSSPPEIREGSKPRHILTVGGEIISSTELFNQGRIPDRFLHLFPTTAHFINGLWFQEANKDWNKIPDNHVIGAEECPMFINTTNPYV